MFSVIHTLTITFWKTVAVLVCLCVDSSHEQQNDSDLDSVINTGEQEWYLELISTKTQLFSNSNDLQKMCEKYPDDISMISFSVHCLKGDDTFMNLEASYEFPQCLHAHDRKSKMLYSITCEKPGFMKRLKFTFNRTERMDKFRFSLPALYTEWIPCILKAEIQSNNNLNHTDNNRDRKIITEVKGSFKCPHPISHTYKPVMFPIGEISSNTYRLVWHTDPPEKVTFRADAYELNCGKCIVEILTFYNELIDDGDLGDQYYSNSVDFIVKGDSRECYGLHIHDKAAAGATGCHCRIRGLRLQNNVQHQTDWSKAIKLKNIPGNNEKCWLPFVNRFLNWRAKFQQFNNEHDARHDVSLLMGLLTVLIFFGVLSMLLLCYRLRIGRSVEHAKIGVQTEKRYLKAKILTGGINSQNKYSPASGALPSDTSSVRRSPSPKNNSQSSFKNSRRTMQKSIAKDGEKILIPNNLTQRQRRPPNIKAIVDKWRKGIRPTAAVGLVSSPTGDIPQLKTPNNDQLILLPFLSTLNLRYRKTILKKSGSEGNNPYHENDQSRNNQQPRDSSQDGDAVNLALRRTDDDLKST